MSLGLGTTWAFWASVTRSPFAMLFKHVPAGYGKLISGTTR